jgi:hypothetical protein
MTRMASRRVVNLDSLPHSGQIPGPDPVREIFSRTSSVIP